MSINPFEKKTKQIFKRVGTELHPFCQKDQKGVNFSKILSQCSCLDLQTFLTDEWSEDSATYKQVKEADVPASHSLPLLSQLQLSSAALWPSPQSVSARSLSSEITGELTTLHVSFS